jgi:putative pyridoxal-dependent aspartate 1-decarboxylase
MSTILAPPKIPSSSEDGKLGPAEILSLFQPEAEAVSAKSPSLPENGKLLPEEIISLFHPDEAEKDKGYTAMMGNAYENVFLRQNNVTTTDLSEDDLGALFNAHSIQEESSTVTEYIARSLVPVINNSIHCCAPTMIGHMTSSLPYYIRPLSKLVTTLHANNVKVETGKASTFLEKETLAMLHHCFYSFSDEFYKEYAPQRDTCLGVVCSGGTIANNTALWIARNKCLPADGDFQGCDKDGLAAGLIHHGFKKAVVIGSAVMHYSVMKSADILGIGTNSLKKVAFDPDYSVNIPAMRTALEECRAQNIAVIALIGVAGGTETGSVDNLMAIAELAAEFNVHFHVDGAWGGPVIFSKYGRKLLSGIERADTITIDGHKQLYTPMGCGICLLKDPNQIDAVKKTANYIIRKQSHDLGKFSMEGSRPAVSMFLHANLRILGYDGFAFLMDRSIGLTRYMVAALRTSRHFEIMMNPMTNILLYRFVPEKDGLRDLVESGTALTVEQNGLVDACNVSIQNCQKHRGKTFTSRTTIYSHIHDCMVVVMRVVIANPLTTESDVDLVIEDQIEIAKEIIA